MSKIPVSFKLKIVRLVTKSPVSHFVIRNSKNIWILLYHSYIYLFNTRKTRKLKDKYQGQTIVCVGNGPSLTKEQIFIAQRYPFIATNRAHQLFLSSSFEDGGHGWIIINDDNRCLEVLPDLPTSYKNVVFSTYMPSSFLAVIKLLREGWLYANASWQVVWQFNGLNLNPDKSPLFSYNFARRYFPGRSVIFSAIQLAYYMGAKKIILIGCDMDFGGKVQYSELIKLERLRLGHNGEFIYETGGKQHMIECRERLYDKGVTLVNATPTGAIKELPRIDIADFEKMIN